MLTQEQWVEGLYLAHGGVVLAAARRILGDPEAAADVAQEVFCRLMKLEAPPESPRAWLLTVSRNLAIDELRARKRSAEFPAEVAQSRAHEDDTLTRVMVRSASKGLSLRERLALTMAVVSGEPIERVADRLDLSYPATAQVISRARRRLATAIRATGAAVTGGVDQVASALDRLVRRRAPRSGWNVAPAHVTFITASLVTMLQMGSGAAQAAPVALRAAAPASLQSRVSAAEMPAPLTLAIRTGTSVRATEAQPAAPSPGAAASDVASVHFDQHGFKAGAGVASTGCVLAAAQVNEPVVNLTLDQGIATCH